MTEPAPPRPVPSKPRTYTGGCDCGAVLYEVELDANGQPAHTHSVWERRVPARSFRLLSGNENLSGYQFADQDAHHFYCDRCGAHAFSHWRPQAEAASYSFDVKALHGRAASRVKPSRVREGFESR